MLKNLKPLKHKRFVTRLMLPFGLKSLVSHFYKMLHRTSGNIILKGRKWKERTVFVVVQILSVNSFILVLKWKCIHIALKNLSTEVFTPVIRAYEAGKNATWELKNQNHDYDAKLVWAGSDRLIPRHTPPLLVSSTFWALNGSFILTQWLTFIGWHFSE